MCFFAAPKFHKLTGNFFSCPFKKILWAVRWNFCIKATYQACIWLILKLLKLKLSVKMQIFFLGLPLALIEIFQSTPLNLRTPFPPRGQHKNSKPKKIRATALAWLNTDECVHAFVGDFEVVQLNIYPAGIYLFKVHNFKKFLVEKLWRPL